MRGDQLGGGEGGEGGDVPEGDLDLLRQCLGEDGVPGDGGGDHCVAGHQTQTSLLLCRVESPDPCGQTAQRCRGVDGLGGEDVVGLDGDTVGVGESGVVLLGSQEQLDDAGLHNRLRLVDGRALSDDLTPEIEIKIQTERKSLT